MEKAGTGGALFRNLYRDFLGESYELLHLRKLKNAQQAFAEIALLWTTVAQLFEKTSETKDVQYILEASGVLKTLSVMEKEAMETLASL